MGRPKTAAFVSSRVRSHSFSQHCSNKTFRCSEKHVKDESYKCSVEFSCEIGDCGWMGHALDNTKSHIKQHLVDTGYLVR